MTNDRDFEFNTKPEAKELLDKLSSGRSNNLRQTIHNTHENDDYVFFWGSLFSNWAKCEFIHEGIKYSSSEQAMMAAKAKMFGDVGAYHDIMNTDDPSEQKKIGRVVENFNKTIWENQALDIVTEIVYSKFSQNPHFADILLSTGKKKIVEASSYDQIWGIGMHASDPDILDETKWRGLNWLGKALMQARTRLIEEFNTKENNL